jgi:hypothetical protein
MYFIYKIGEKLVNFLVEPKKGTKWPSKLLRFQNRHDAILICKELCKHQYLLRSEKCGKGELEVRFYYFYYLLLFLFNRFNYSFFVAKDLPYLKLLLINEKYRYHVYVILMKLDTLHGYIKVIKR